MFAVFDHEYYTISGTLINSTNGEILFPDSIKKYAYKEDSSELIENLSSGILDGEVTDKCAHEMKLQIGNKYWATNGYMIEKPLDTAPMIRHDRTFIEIRSVTEKVGAEISWIANERAVVIKGLKGEDIKLKIGNPVAIVNGEEVQIDDAGIIPFIENGRTMLPLRFVSESLGLVVSWDAEKKIITLLYENPVCVN
ncbi:MAG: stalk domain-containing protein [Caldisericia bacterium]